MNSTKINTLLARSKDILNLVEGGELDPVNNHEDMIDIHNFTLELGEAFKDSYYEEDWSRTGRPHSLPSPDNYKFIKQCDTDRLLAAFREVRRVLPIMENDKRWQSWAAHEACN